ncbi:MAG: HU family DNA-binding protein [Verrucomicrobiae bacterium]|nr:HU family DNA-binding protein [Verrucomicrobiae bacterium]
MANVTKRDLVIKISNETGLIQQDVLAVIQKCLDHVTDYLAEGRNVELRNFGVFEVKIRKPRVGRNPNAPETDVQIPARAVVKFKAGKEMRKRVLDFGKKSMPSASGGAAGTPPTA